MREIKQQSKLHYFYYILFGAASAGLIWYYLSSTIFYFTTPRQFAINSLERFPLTWLIFPAEVFSVAFGLYFVYTLLSDKTRTAPLGTLKNKKKINVAFLLPVYNEPKDIVERTLKKIKQVEWPGKISIYLLDDSTNDADIKNMATLARKYKTRIVRRDDRIGYKAGNVNNALRGSIKEPYFVILDADQAPEKEFLLETMDYFSDASVGFVQTPQHFVNITTPLERAVKIGTDIFYQGMCTAKARDRAVPFCGTNAITRRDVFEKVGGFAYYTATEDLELGIRMNAAGFRGEFVAQNLVKGYAPPDFKAYSTQQYRWANGNLAVLRESWRHLLFGNFDFRYQVHQFFTLAWWLIGLVTLIYIITPILSIFVGGTHHTWLPTALLVWIFIHVILGVGMIYVSLHNRTEDKITIKDALLEYSLITNSMFIYARAAINALSGRYIGFVRTNKTRSASSWAHVRWNLILAAICYTFSIGALLMAARAVTFEQVRMYLPISLWMLFYAIVLTSSLIFIGEGNNE